MVTDLPTTVTDLPTTVTDAPTEGTAQPAPPPTTGGGEFCGPNNNYVCCGSATYENNGYCDCGGDCDNNLLAFCSCELAASASCCGTPTLYPTLATDLPTTVTDLPTAVTDAPTDAEPTPTPTLQGACEAISPAGLPRLAMTESNKCWEVPSGTTVTGAIYVHEDETSIDVRGTVSGEVYVESVPVAEEAADSRITVYSTGNVNLITGSRYYLSVLDIVIAGYVRKYRVYEGMQTNITLQPGGTIDEIEVWFTAGFGVTCNGALLEHTTSGSTTTYSGADCPAL